jgi:hypothetical protein
MQKKRSATNARFRPGTTGACESQLWIFVGPQRMLKDNAAPEVHLDRCRIARCGVTLHAAALRRFHYHGGPAFLDMIPLLSGSPLD